jgi:hypothetical protein
LDILEHRAMEGEQRPVNLAALHQKLQEMAARTKSTAKERPVVVQGPVLVIRGK